MTTFVRVAFDLQISSLLCGVSEQEDGGGSKLEVFGLNSIHFKFNHGQLTLYAANVKVMRRHRK